MMMFSFAAVIEGVDLISPDSPYPDSLYEAGCADAVLESASGVQRAVFDREADTFAHAVASAISELESVAGARVVRVERLASVAEQPEEIPQAA